MWRIISRLYLGDQRVAADALLIASAGITHVLNCAYDVPCYHRRTFRYLHLKLNDPDPGFIDCIPQICTFIHKGRRAGGVLVHCRAGLSRSPSAVLAYLCSRGKTLRQALRILQRGVGETNTDFFEPDELFLEQLREYFEP